MLGSEYESVEGDLSVHSELKSMKIRLLDTIFQELTFGPYRVFVSDLAGSTKVGRFTSKSIDFCCFNLA